MSNDGDLLEEAMILSRGCQLAKHILDILLYLIDLIHTREYILVHRIHDALPNTIIRQAKGVSRTPPHYCPSYPSFCLQLFPLPTSPLQVPLLETTLSVPLLQ